MKKTLRMKIMLLLFALVAEIGNAWAQDPVTLVSGSGTSSNSYSIPSGWSTSGTVSGGSYLKFDNGTMTSPEFAPHKSLTFTYSVATFGSTTNHPLTVRIRNASTNAIITEETTSTPTSTTYVNGEINLGNCNVGFKIEFYAPSNKGIRLRNYSVTGNPAYTVTYASNGGTGTMTDSDSPYIEGATVTLLNNGFTAPANKTFNGWIVTDAESSPVTILNNQFTMPASNVTVTAQWADAGSTTYSVTYDPNGATSGSVPTDNTAYNSGESVTVQGNSGNLTKTGNAFNGWCMNAEGTGTVYGPNNTTTFNITANTTLYAKWTPYTITAASNNNSYGTVQLNGTVITASPADGYTRSEERRVGKEC